MLKKILLLLLLAPGLFGCESSEKNQEKSQKPCGTFTNPIKDGADPWVFKKDGYYYFCESKNGGIYVSKSKSLIDPGEGKLVWKQPEEGWNQTNLWAPELHWLNGKWYIYYAAGKAGPPFTSQRAGVLQSVGTDPQGEYESKGQFYTGDQISSQTNNKWAIDLTVLNYQNQLYAIWSGWQGNRKTDKTSQHLYIATMSNPWTISSNRVKISSPEESWEISSSLPINEGPQVLKHNGETFIIYSASQSWLPSYKLGQLRLTGDDPMKAVNWQKKGPVFQGTEEVHGVGHASFTTSPDGTEHWILYHSKKDTTPGWNRNIRAQSFGWNPDGSPDFGMPVPTGKPLAVPSGTCE